jgi:Cys-tRNA synthase (O-phospho-L-seryl-tRNA:Cys-tRNA synthase)
MSSTRQTYFIVCDGDYVNHEQLKTISQTCKPYPLPNNLVNADTVQRLQLVSQSGSSDWRVHGEDTTSRLKHTSL